MSVGNYVKNKTQTVNKLKQKPEDKKSKTYPQENQNQTINPYTFQKPKSSRKQRLK